MIENLASSSVARLLSDLKKLNVIRGVLLFRAARAVLRLDVERVAELDGVGARAVVRQPRAHALRLRRE